MTSSEEYAGMPAKKLSTQKVEDLLKTEELFILDVRPISFSHCDMFLKNSFHLPLLVLADNLEDIPRNKKILITDSAAKQAQLAYKFLVKRGYQVIGVLRGGLEVWCSEGRASEQRDIVKEKVQLIGDESE